FLHKIDGVSFSAPILVPCDEQIPKGAIELIVTASNLPEPHRKTLPVKVTYREGDTDKAVESLIAKMKTVGYLLSLDDRNASET
ncbi:MAG: hypothetical protein Q7I92_13415, partial [Humidesulfovibrio sp.]|nr:hypothetical protein [Humidesulfovibrio sp.]